MTFAQPLWLWGLLLLPLFALLAWGSERARRRHLGALVAARLQERLAGSVSHAGRRSRLLLLLLGLAALLVALARPQKGYVVEERETVGRDLILALDVSKSMLANDLHPSRLARAKLAAEDLLTKLKGDRVGLVVFAGSAFLQAPLTADYSALQQSLRELNTDSIPVGGTNLAEAIRTARDAFGEGESDARAVIIITDGEELSDDATEAARQAAGALRIFTLGAGTPEGTVLSITDASGRPAYVRDPQGGIVQSKLDEPRLRAIAEATGGFYLHLQNGPAEMDQIMREGLQPMAASRGPAESTRRPLERYRWPLSAGLFFLAASLLPRERRRVAPALLLAGSLALGSAPASAKNAGVDAYERQEYGEALSSFEQQLRERPGLPELQFDAGSAAYKAGDYEKALGAFSQALGPGSTPALRQKAEYNLGNTLFQRGAAQKEKPAKLKDWNNSLQHFDEALRARPGDADARFNRDLVQRKIEELRQEKPPEKQPKQKHKQDRKQKKPSFSDQKDSSSPPDSGDPQPGGEEGQEGQPRAGQGQEKSSGKQGQPSPEEEQGKEGEEKEDRQPMPGQEDRKLQGDLADAPQQPKEGEGKGAQDNNDQKDEQGEGHQEKPDASENQGEEKQGSAQARSEPGDPKGGEAKEPAQTAEEKRAEEEALAAAEGKMTPTQARALLDSLKGADDRVRLLNPRTNSVRRDRARRDW